MSGVQRFMPSRSVSNPEKNVSRIMANGGAITYAGGYVIHSFLSSANFVLQNTGAFSNNFEVLIVGGGGGTYYTGLGGNGGSGGGGAGSGGSGGGTGGGLSLNSGVSGSTTAGGNGGANTGGGGGAGRGETTSLGGSGGSGIVIVRYLQ